MTPAPPPQLAADWISIQGELRRVVSDSDFAIWLEPLKPLERMEDILVVAAPNEIRTWVAERFAGILQSCAASVLGPRISVDVVSSAAPGITAARRGHGVQAEQQRSPDQPLHPKLTFDQFVIGDTNRFAHAAALAVAELPGQAYNPLFLYGPPGVGKTHLLHSIGAYVLAFGNGLTVRYTTVERFTNEFLASLHAGDVDAFKARFRHNDVLLIDDVQFLESKVKTEEEFFHTFNALHETGSQIVVTSDRLPRDMAALEDRLRERFEAGLVADIRPPDLPTRMAILRKRAQHDAIVIEDAVLAVIARRITVNARALEGALIRVVAFQSLTGRALDGALAEEVLSGLYPGDPERSIRGPANRPTIDLVQEMTCEAFGVTRDELLSASRTGRVAWPRQVAMYLARAHTGETLPAIGARFGGRDHSTVVHACKRTRQRIDADLEAGVVVRDLARRLVEPSDQASTARRADRRC